MAFNPEYSFKVCWLHWTLSESALLVSFHSPPFSCLRSPFHPEPCHLQAALPPSSRTLTNTGLVLPRSEGSRPALKCCRFSRMRPGISHSLSTPAQWQMEKSRPTRLSPVTCFSLPLHALISLSPPLLFCVSPLCSRTAKPGRVSAHDSGRILYFQMLTGACINTVLLQYLRRASLTALVSCCVLIQSLLIHISPSKDSNIIWMELRDGFPILLYSMAIKGISSQQSNPDQVSVDTS